MNTEKLAIRVDVARLRKQRLARECAKLDLEFEKALAEDCLTQDLKEWPKY